MLLPGHDYRDAAAVPVGAARNTEYVAEALRKKSANVRGVWHIDRIPSSWRKYFFSVVEGR